MGIRVQLNYDELRMVIKQFRDEGEDIVQMHSAMRDRVHDLHKDWIGQGAEKFFKEMENDLLPALSRLAGALFFAQDVLQKITKTIQSFDEDTVGYFKVDFDQVNPINPGAFIAGAGVGAGMGGMLGGSLPEGLPDARGSRASIRGTVEQAREAQSGSGQIGGRESAIASSQGLQGHLQGIGGRVDTQVGPVAGGRSNLNEEITPENIYDPSSGKGAGRSSTQALQGASSAGGGVQGSAESRGSLPAGAAGVAGSAAIAGTGKSIKGRIRNKKK